MKQENIIFKLLMAGLVSGSLMACGSKTDNDDSGKDDGNQAPVISGSPANSIDEGASYSFTPTATDSDGDTLTFSISSLPHWANFNTQTGTLNGTPGLDDAADYGNIIISVSDGNATAELSAFMISVLNTNQIPVISGTPANAVNEGDGYSFTPTATDSDSGTLTFSISSLPHWANFNTQTGTLNGTPGLDDATDYGDIIISVSDGTATAELSAFMISVLNTNQIPVISGTPANTVNEGESYSFTPTATDSDGDTLSFSIRNLPHWANFNNQTGTLNGPPGLDDAADYGNIIISVSDGNATAELSAFSITVVGVNQALVVNTHSPTTLATGVPLHSNITLTFNAPLDAATVTGTSITLQGTSNTAISTTLSTDNQTLTIDPISDLEPLTAYTVTVTTAVANTSGTTLDSDYSWNFTTLTGLPIPGIAQWEENMLANGEHWGQYLTNLHPAPGYYNEQVTTYYDAQRVYYQIAEYTGQQEPWHSYALEAKRIYLNYIENSWSDYFGWDFSFPGYRRFAQGFYMEYALTGSSSAYTNLAKLRDQPAFSSAGTWAFSPLWYQERYSREIAYALDAHIFAERAGYERDVADVARYVSMALYHINEWVTQEFSYPDSHRTAPFMVALTAEALIKFYEWELENNRDPTAIYANANAPTEFVPTITIPEAIKSIADYLRDEAVVISGVSIGKSMWVDDVGGRGGAWTDEGGTGYSTFRYEDIKNGEPTVDLNLLIAPMYAWLFQHYGEMKYINTADQLFATGVALAGVGWNTKIFNQNYRWSFDYIKWRNEGFAKWD